MIMNAALEIVKMGAFSSKVRKNRNGIKLSRKSLVEKALPQDASGMDHVRILLRTPLLAPRLRPARAMRVDDQIGQRRTGG
jgi:hypothetical protein